MANEHSGERWLPVKGFGGRYEVSSRGRVRSWAKNQKGRVLKPQTTRKGYQRVNLYGPGGDSEYRVVHRLVLFAFVGPPPPGHETSHLNGNPADNRVENLSWATPAENTHLQVEHGTARRGELHGCARLTEGDVLDILARCAAGEPRKALAAEYGITKTHVGCIVTGENWKHVGSELRAALAAYRKGEG